MRHIHLVRNVQQRHPQPKHHPRHRPQLCRAKLLPRGDPVANNTHKPLLVLLPLAEPHEPHAHPHLPDQPADHGVQLNVHALAQAGGEELPRKGEDEEEPPRDPVCDDILEQQEEDRQGASEEAERAAHDQADVGVRPVQRVPGLLQRARDEEGLLLDPQHDRLAQEGLAHHRVRLVLPPLGLLVPDLDAVAPPPLVRLVEAPQHGAAGGEERDLPELEVEHRVHGDVEKGDGEGRVLP
mmetsp:Transcript_48621/g.121398  ORF Transcript_48621/g.121398 Transcript_48621/m.121398 type:complete len:239 (+) Transcript_48621:272-988(+)